MIIYFYATLDYFFINPFQRVVLIVPRYRTDNKNQDLDEKDEVTFSFAPSIGITLLLTLLRLQFLKYLKPLVFVALPKAENEHADHTNDQYDHLIVLHIDQLVPVLPEYLLAVIKTFFVTNINELFNINNVIINCNAQSNDGEDRAKQVTLLPFSVYLLLNYLVLQINLLLFRLQSSQILRFAHGGTHVVVLLLPHMQRCVPLQINDDVFMRLYQFTLPNYFFDGPISQLAFVNRTGTRSQAIVLRYEHVWGGASCGTPYVVVHLFFRYLNKIFYYNFNTEKR